MIRRAWALNATPGVFRSLHARWQHSAVQQLSGLSDANDVSNQVQDIPQVNGSGPFKQEPRFSVVGHPPAMLHVSLPASSTIYARRGSIMGVNGELSNITSTLDLSRPLESLARTTPLLYHKVTTVTPTTLLVSSSRSSASNRFCVLDLDGKTEYTICQRQALLGWTSSSVNLDSSSRWSRWGDVTASGTGQIALVGEGDLFRIDVSSSEQIVLNPAHILAYKTATKPRLARLNHSPRYIELPELVTGWFANLRSSLPSVPVLARLGSWSKSLASRLLWRDDITATIHGPASVIVQTNGTPLKHIFTKAELHAIVERA